MPMASFALAVQSVEEYSTATTLNYALVWKKVAASTEIKTLSPTQQ